MDYAKRAKYSRTSSDAIDTRVDEYDSQECADEMVDQDVCVSSSPHQANVQSNLFCAGCGKPMDVPMQLEDDAEVYCELCLRKKMIAVRDHFQIFDADVYRFHRDRQDFDVHEPGFQ